MSAYALVNFRLPAGRYRPGILVGKMVFDLRPAFAEVQADTESPPDTASMIGLLANWEWAEPLIARFAQTAASGELQGLPIDGVALGPPLPCPGTVYCVGANYRDHVEEMAKVNGRPLEADPKSKGIKPWFFIKPSRGCVVGPDADVKRPDGCSKLDWEVELTAVIGKTARNVSVDAALGHVAGYMIANDLSARDLFRRPQIDAASPFHHDWLAHKGFEGSCPTGPWITPARQIRNPQGLALNLWVNGVIKQESNTSEMIFSVAEQISHISSLVTLYPGDLVLTGTPAGVGSARQEFLGPGDKVRIEIESLGELCTNIV